MTTQLDQQPSHDLETIMTGQLPALPQSAMQLLQVSKDPENGPNEFAVPIEADPGLTSQVLKFVNSSYFGFSREIATVRLAINLVGIRTIKNFALWSAVFSLVPNPKCGPLDMRRLWQDSLRRALFAREMAKQLGMSEAEEVFAAGLLQDLALPILAKELNQDYEILFIERDARRCRLSLLEKQRFGWDHAEAGAKFSSAWNFPEEISRLIAMHANPATLRVSRHEDPAALAVALSALLPASIDTVWQERDAFEANYIDVGGRLVPPLTEMLAQTDEEFAEFAPILEMTPPPVALVDLYLQEREDV